MGSYRSSRGGERAHRGCALYSLVHTLPWLLVTVTHACPCTYGPLCVPPLFPARYRYEETLDSPVHPHAPPCTPMHPHEPLCMPIHAHALCHTLFPARYEETLESPRLSTFSGSTSPSPKAFRSMGLAGPSGQVCVWGSVDKGGRGGEGRLCAWIASRDFAPGMALHISSHICIPTPSHPLGGGAACERGAQGHGCARPRLSDAHDPPSPFPCPH